MRWLFVILFAGLGLMLVYVGVTQFFMQRRIAAHARPVQAEIIRTEIIRSDSRDTDRSVTRNTSTVTYSPEITFRYSVKGVAYESDLLRPNIIVTSFASREAAAEEIAAFPVGAQVQAWADEAHPDKAFLLLEKGIGPIVFMLVGPVALLAAGLAWRFL